MIRDELLFDEGHRSAISISSRVSRVRLGVARVRCRYRRRSGFEFGPATRQVCGQAIHSSSIAMEISPSRSIRASKSPFVCRRETGRGRRVLRGAVSIFVYTMLFFLPFLFFYQPAAGSPLFGSEDTKFESRMVAAVWDMPG